MKRGDSVERLEACTESGEVGGVNGDREDVGRQRDRFQGTAGANPVGQGIEALGNKVTSGQQKSEAGSLPQHV